MERHHNAEKFSVKPGVLPGKPIAIGGINSLKAVARIEARQRGVKLDCRKLNKTSARLAIGYLEARRQPGSIEQRGGAVVIHLGGAR